MSLTLGTVSSPVVDGRCTGCGRFIRRSESHFHDPDRRKFRGPPKAHLYNWGEGAIVTRCDDVERARALAIERYRRKIDDEPGEAEERFPIDGATVQRGRVNVMDPDLTDFSWYWQQLPDDAKGPGITTAVVWRA